MNKESLKTQMKDSGSGRHSPLTRPQVVLKKACFKLCYVRSKVSFPQGKINFSFIMVRELHEHWVDSERSPQD